MTPAPGTSPRTVTQLIVNSDVDPTSPTYNPAAAAAMEQMGGEPVEVSNTVVGSTQTAFIPNPGILGGVPYNEFFVEFGQFFDHGLDFITKGGGYVLIPLSPSDPLYDPTASGPTANMMMLSRGALSNPASDFVIDSLGNAVLNPNAVPAFNNSTGLLIDQSQTYGSHSSINVLVRQYDADGIVTGKLITSAEDGNGSDHNLATWADMKVNAARLGIELTDVDVLDAPMIRADAIGRIMFTPQHAVMYRSDTKVDDTTGYNAANDPFVRWSQADADAHLCFASQVGSARRSGQAVISDMGNAANPMSPMGQLLMPMGTTDPTAVPGPGNYNEALLASHFVSGDHRANENVGLTTMHFIFHEEHNLEADAIKAAVIAQAGLQGDVSTAGAAAEAAYLAQWQIAPGVWDGEKIYQAARIITESEYNHIAIDQYVGTLVALPEFVSYSADVNLDISLEFAQAVFRLGHSQLTETMRIAIPDGNGVPPGEAGYIPTYTSVGLFDAFLNPALYDAVGPSGIALGLLNQQGNEIDEFVTAALQQSLVGTPLDLAALNISRGRDVGLPTLNEARQQIFDGLVQNTNNASNPGIAPYTSWEDFGGHLRHAESLVNFIAAYGHENTTFHLQDKRVAYEAGTVTLQDLRANAQHILDAAADLDDPDHDDAVLFLRGQGSPLYDPITGTWNQNDNGGGDLGFWDVDLWIGGLAEQPLFDGPLGTTFTYIMADFGQRMQDGDRFYYLYRMPVGHHLGDQIIGEQFSDLIMRTTGLENIGDAFGFQSATYILDGTSNDNPYDGTFTTLDANGLPTPGSGATDTYGIHDYFNSTYESLPDSTRALVVANNSFEVGSLASDGSGPVHEDAVKGNWSLSTEIPIPGWTVSGSGVGGLINPTTPADSTDPAQAPMSTETGHAGQQVAWLSPGGVLSRDLGQTIVAGNSYSATVNLGNRLDMSGTFEATIRLLDTAGHVVALRIVTASEVTEGEWAHIVLSGLAGQNADGNHLVVQISNTGSGKQIFIDNVNVAEIAPGGSANDGHNVIAGLEGNDYLIAGLGDDYVYGGDGDDVIEGAQGNDHLYGGAGNDWITDYENDDFIYGGDGDDYISAGPGVLDTSHGGNGNDIIHGGDGVDEVFGDDGDDALFGDGDTDLIVGGDGNDYLDGGDSVDEMFGGNGNDWLRGGVGDDNINGGSGNDLMEGGLGPTANDGDRLNGDSPITVGTTVIEYNGDGTEGDMDIASYEDVTIPIYASLQDSNANGSSSNLLDTYAYVEGLVGSAKNDELTGADAATTTSNGPNNYLIGGAGNDRLTGLGGDDLIVGDSLVVDNNLYWVGDARHEATGHGDVVGYTTEWGQVRPVFTDGSKGHILGDNGADGDMDVAVFRGNRADYTIEIVVVNGQNTIRVTDNRDPGDATFDGVDTLIGIELAEFADGTFALNSNDVISPETTAAVTAGTEGTNGWYTSAVTIDLSATDNSTGVFATYYSLDSGTTWATGTSVVVPASAQGTTTVYFRSLDNAGNIEAVQSITVMIDTAAPTVTVVENFTTGPTDSTGATVDFSNIASDTISGLFSLVLDPASDHFLVGTNTVTYTATDNAGNSTTGTFTVTVNPVGFVAGQLFVVGTSADQTFVINALDTAAVIVKIGGVAVPGSPFYLSGGETIVAYGNDGNDTFTLLGDVSATLYGGTGDDTFTVTRFTGTGTLSGGGGADTVVATKNVETISLSDATLSSSDNMVLTLFGIGTANITGGFAANTFNVTNWSGGGTLTPVSGYDTLNYTSDAANIVLTDSLVSGVGSMAISGFKVAHLTGGPSSNTFDVGGWTSINGGSSVTGGGGSDMVIATRNADFDLSNARLRIDADQRIKLIGINTVNLTGGADNNTFTLNGWTGSGSITGGSMTNTVMATKASGFTLTDGSLSAGDGMNMNLTGITHATLTSFGTANRSVDARDFTGTTSLMATGSGKVQMYGGSGDDTMILRGSIFGYMLGREGTDTLTANGSGRTILIGGAGADSLTSGTNGQALMIGAKTIYSNGVIDEDALDAILAEWASAGTYGTRRNNILAGVGPLGEYALTDLTVLDDGAQNTMTGPTGNGTRNWFIKRSTPAEVIFNKRTNETVTQL